MSVTLKIYRRLARAFPHEFKMAYGRDVVQLGEDVVEETARRHGTAGLVRLVADIAIRLPIEYLSEMRRDMRYAARALIKSPGFALVGVISMGIGIGVITNVYQSELAELFRDLPAAANAKRLVMPLGPVSYYYVEQYREQKSLFAGVLALQTGVAFNVVFSGDKNAPKQRVFGQLVSPDYFSVLGVRPQRGRLLSPELDRPGAAPAVVISDRFWRNRLNSSPDAVGQTLRVNGQEATIVGITPREFNGALFENPAEMFVPITVPPGLAPELANDVLHQRHAREFRAIMCLAPGVSVESAEAGLDAITRHLDQQDSSEPAPADKSRRVTLLSAGTMVPMPRNLKPVIIGFFAVLMGLVITLASMNLANMLLARGANRRKELAVRLAIGASRSRLVRQMISEGLLLSLLGGVAGFALAYGLSVLNLQFREPTVVPSEPASAPDWHVGLFVFALAIVCGIAFSLLPALRATKADLTPALKHGAVLPLPAYWRFGLRNMLMVGQVAGSLMLVLITGFLVIGISEVSRVQTRFDPRTMYLLSIDPVRDGYTAEKTQAFFERLPQRLKTVGAAGSIAFAAQLPFSDEGERIEVSTEGSRVQKRALKETVGAGYFAALSEPMLAGRDFNDADQRSQGDESKALPVVLNATAAHDFFENGNAIGKRLKSDSQSYEIVGVVPDLKSGIGFTQTVIYLPLTQRDFARPAAGGITIMLRSDAGADAVNGVRREIASIDPNLTILNVQTLNEFLELNQSSTRFAVSTYGGIGLFGLILASIGLAGVTAYAVARRRKEIGIRMALGAQKGQVLRLVLGESVALIGVGTVLGFLGAVALVKILGSLANILVESFRVGTNDLRLLIGAPLLLAALALLACYVPARKSTQIDPLKALRQE